MNRRGFLQALGLSSAAIPTAVKATANGVIAGVPLHGEIFTGGVDILGSTSGLSPVRRGSGNDSIADDVISVGPPDGAPRRRVIPGNVAAGRLPQIVFLPEVMPADLIDDVGSGP